MIASLLVAALLAPPALVEAEVVRALKQSERLAFEEHDLGAQLRHFAKDARWITGRRAVPDAYDVVFDLKAARAVLALDLGDAPAGGRLDFMKTEADLEADPPTVRFVEVRKFHGGRSLVGVRFVLRTTARGWAIAERRQWDLEERTSVIPTLYDDAYWLDADAVIDQPGTDSARERLDALMAARRYGEARALAKRLLDGPPPHGDWWGFLSQAEFRLGNLDAARAAGLKARASGTSAVLPRALFKATPKRR